MFVTGVGLFTAEPGPDGQSAWSPQKSVFSALFAAPVEVNVLLADGQSADLDLIAEVLGDVDSFLLTGLHFLHSALTADPETFGLDPTDAAKLQPFDPTAFPVDMPQLNFYAEADTEWLMRFAQGLLPICEPYGVAVAFAGSEPARVEDLSESAQI
ncbi:hypothetical protein SAMN05444583_12023 [Rhodococcus maanshanensis]|uniref:Uncharacterized protein n=1 Tax=Rhodococcus maanshanensis TaxID=183556 RepID=A0A1H7V0C6_9NOCA|nr:hypothetical protein SAMN05444583_12023 [Rhodococcus maanshanensis]